ncbi:MAG: hypothetical protein EOO60_03405 [Hymenobacter sp.]|nr:MAG: hypothetical protein EOO60_03405 [Hymenobacter sp.]
MKHLLLALSLLLATGAHAQTALPPKYCLLYTRGSSFASIGLRLDYGQNLPKELVVQDATLLNLAKQIERFNSVPGALTYLDSQGWEVAQVATLHSGAASEVGYLLRRRP